MVNLFKKQITRLRFWVKEKPQKAKPILAIGGLAVLLLICVLIALMMQNNKDESPIASTNQSVATVQITNNGFVPATLVVKKGTKIIWTNSDEANHQIQANPHPTGESLPGLKSEILNNTQTYEYTANTSGTFGYHDKLTPTTDGTIEVKD